MKTLYISYDGMTDSLGQAQVIPYLRGLARLGHEITVLSCEKPERFSRSGAEVRDQMTQFGIQWHPVIYHKRPPVLSTLFDLMRLRHAAFKLHRKSRFEAVHCRSYIPSLIGLVFTQRYGLPFIFDMRGFWADERVDGGLWNQKRWIYRKIYRYFKNREREFLANAASIVSLTHLAKAEIQRWGGEGGRELPIEIIPCCTDLTRFDRNRMDESKLDELRSRLGIEKSDFVVAYLGSLGTWYMLDEMLLMFKKIQKADPRARFLMITPDSPKIVQEAAARHQIDTKSLVITSAPHSEVPSYLSLAHLGLFFIKPSYSKMSSSPTKLGEFLALGLPVITNSGMGDNNWFFKKYPVGALTQEFTESEYERVAAVLPALLSIPSARIRLAAEEYFSLERGVIAYDRIYQSLSLKNKLE